MTYVDTTLTPAATYTYVHNGQIYDQIATTLTAHGNWQYVEYVDATSGGNTFRRHVWRCKSAGSGLPSDFYVMFQTQFVTATGVYSTSTPVYLAMAEAYSSGTLSKIASNKNSITPASDLTNPATWTLSTFTAPTNIFWQGNSNNVVCGPASNVTSVRLIYIVAKDVIMTNFGTYSNSMNPNTNYPSYVGAYETTLGVADPMPLVICGVYGGVSSSSVGGSTRAPTQTVGVAITEVFATAHHWYPQDGQSSFIGASHPRYAEGIGTLGLPSDTNWTKSDGGVQMLRSYLSSYTQTPSTNSTKGFVRGYYKYVRVPGAGTATHSMGDTFLIDGKVYFGLGVATHGLWDTTAS